MCLGLGLCLTLRKPLIDVKLHIGKVFTHIILGKTGLPCFSRVLVDSISLPLIPHCNFYKKISKKQGCLLTLCLKNR